MPRHIPKTGVPSLTCSLKISLIVASFLEAVEKFPTPGRTITSTCLSSILENPMIAVKPILLSAHLRL
jgi:hypothetical protein